MNTCISTCLSRMVSFSVESAFSFTIRNCYCYLALSPIRTQLQSLITEVSTPHLGQFAAQIVGKQMGLLSSLSVTHLYADMTAAACMRLAGSIYDLFLRLTTEVHKEVSKPLLRECVLQISSYCTAFFAKTYFCNYAMPYVQLALRQIAVISGPILGLSFVPSICVLPVIIVITPTITTFIGEAVGSAIGYATYALGDRVIPLRSVIPLITRH